MQCQTKKGGAEKKGHVQKKKRSNNKKLHPFPKIEGVVAKSEQ